MIKSENIKICYFGTYSKGEEYARNNAIIGGLEKNDIEILQCQSDVWPTHEDKMDGMDKGLFTQGWAFLKTYIGLVFRYLGMPDHDFLFVGYIGHIDMFPAWILAKIRRKPIVFDAFYSLYDTVIEDRGLYEKKSLRGRLLRMIDTWSCRLADLVLLDTWEHVDYFIAEFGLSREKFLAIPLGTDEKNFYPRPWPEEDDVLECISYSSYIPLHGIDVQLDAAEILKDNDDVHFTFVGKGQLYNDMRKKAEDANLVNVKFIEWVTHSELVEMIAKADVALGIFGRTQKASRVVPYKAYEALAMRKPLLTGDSEASRNLMKSGENALLSPMGDPQALADNIRKIKDDKDLRKKIAEAGHHLFIEKCTSQKMAEAILDDLKKRWPEKTS
jgi:glycosyltransferase involved in cell wall biosynthesis